LKREKLVKKIAKAVARADNKRQGHALPWAGENQDLYLNGADAALKALAKALNKTPIVPWGDHSIDEELVDFFAGDVDAYAALDER
jgi:hypothetical protein